MNKYLRSGGEISTDIIAAMKRKELTLESCVRSFNFRYRSEIKQGLKKPMNKDFIQRVKTGNFKVVSERIIELCKFLDINPYVSQKKGRYLDKEFTRVEQVIQQRPDLEPQIKQLLNSIIDIAAVQGVSSYD